MNIKLTFQPRCIARFTIRCTLAFISISAFAQSEKTLKKSYENYFSIGVAVSPQSLKTDEASLILKHFNSLTAENAMKMGPIHPKEKEYYWKDADSIVAFAQRNHLRLRGHTLLWHNQTPEWLFKDEKGNDVSKEVLLKRLETHITNVVSRYKGKVYAWDVVNEVISDKAGEYIRDSPWTRICGEDYIAKAFIFAHAADPNALLFYNDYNEIDSLKRSKIVKLVKSLKASGVPIHGIGMQGHWAINEPIETQLENTFRDFMIDGIQLQITELDVSVYPKEHNARERRPEDDNTEFSASREQKQLEVYAMCFRLFRKYKNNLTSVTFWNISDRHSWLDNFPVKNRKDYPLLFDGNLKPKKVFDAVVNFKEH
jgi:endo-1,4-beta-xylanase